MDVGSTLVDRCVVGVDVQAYSQRDTRRQRDLQRDLQQVLSDAAGAAGLDRAAWELFPTGDGELAVLPADVNLLAVLGGFVAELDRVMTLRNADRVPETKIRLRLAVHMDTLTPSIPGHYAGQALIVVSRLLDARPVRRALELAEQAELALIVSAPVYEKVVLSGLLPVRPGDFVAVAADLPAKGFHQGAHVHVPGYDLRAFPLDEPPAGPPAGPPPGRAAPNPAPRTVAPGGITAGRIVAGGDVSIGHQPPLSPE